MSGYFVDRPCTSAGLQSLLRLPLSVSLVVMVGWWYSDVLVALHWKCGFWGFPGGAGLGPLPPVFCWGHLG